MEYKFALIGENVSKSFSKSIHEKFLSDRNLLGRYDLLSIKKFELANTIQFLKESKYTGFNVTIPYKQEVVRFCDELKGAAKDAGVVNTVKIVGSKLIGYNTDGEGLRNAFCENEVALENKNIAILGSGGASKGIEQTFSNENVNDLYVIDRRTNKTFANKIILNSDIIINATPVNNGIPFDLTIDFNSESIFADCVYIPKETYLIKKALSQNAKVLYGENMLYNQALLSFDIWMGDSLSKEEPLSK